jgi:hypothetical protein
MSENTIRPRSAWIHWTLVAVLLAVGLALLLVLGPDSTPLVSVGGSPLP